MRRMKKYQDNLKNFGIMLGLVALATVIGSLFFEMGLHETNITMVYILSVVMTSRFTSSHMEGILASIISLLAFNFFFTAPYYSLKVYDSTYLITFVTMALTAILTSRLTLKYKCAAKEAHEKEMESQALYQMTNHLSDAEDYDSIIRVVVNTVSELFGCHAGYIVLNEDGSPQASFIQHRNTNDLVRRKFDGIHSLKWTMENLKSMYLKGDEFWDWPIYGKNMVYGVLRIPTNIACTLTVQQVDLLQSIIESSSLAMERLHSWQIEVKSREEIAQERYRSNLLRAISHDLRTPLSAILGSSEILMQICESDPNAYSLSKGIYQDADWLYSLVENILSLTRLQQGNMELKKQSEVLEEVIGAAVSTIEKRRPDRKIEIVMPENLIMVSINVSLIHQVLINLLDNAIKHSADDSLITLRVRLESDVVWISILDEGHGILETDLKNIFQMFYTTRGTCVDANRGIGLGLSICQSIVESHGGVIVGENRKDRLGAVFSFSLPVKENMHD